MTEPKYSVGDKVKIVIYGHLMFYNKRMYPEHKANMDAMHREVASKILFGIESNTEVVIDLNTKPDNIIYEDDILYHCDISPELVGQQGIIAKVSVTQGIPKYSIEGIKGKTAWYDEKQLELIRLK